MKIIRRLRVPTGDILVVKGMNGSLELLSLGDYGKDVNVKCHAMGLGRDIERVEHTEMLPLEKKWVITISTQYGCSMGCKFCDVPKVGKGTNATYDDLIDQVLFGISLHPEVTHTERLNIHFARMGEPTWNDSVLDAANWLKKNLESKFKVHPVVSTMMPKHNVSLVRFIQLWMHIKNKVFGGNAGLQLSINSTNEAERNHMFHNNALSLEKIAKVMDNIVPVGRKITLNFAVANYEIDPDVLLKYFNPDNYIIKLTPMHKTVSALQNNIRTDGDYTTIYPYKECEGQLVNAGYDVLVFVASKEEDLGRITCGNAILSGTLPEVPYKEIT